MRIHGWSRRTGGVAFYRIREPLRGLRELGHECTHSNTLDIGQAMECDVIITSVHGEAEGSLGWETLARLPNRPKMVYDIDDDVWNFRPMLHQAKYWEDESRLRNVQSCIAAADVVTTPSAVLAGVVSKLNKNVVVIGNYVPAYILNLLPKRPSYFALGYQGGDTHRFDVTSIGKSILAFMRDFRDTHVHVYGATSYDGLFADRTHLTGWVRDIHQYYAGIAMTVGIAPLERTIFNQGKSGVKAVEYAALGIPAVVTDIEPYRDVVEHGRTGCLVSDPDDWYSVLEYLYENPLVLAQMSTNARRLAAGWTTEANAWRWEAVCRG